MAKKTKKSKKASKIVVKSLNFVAFLISVALFALVLYGNSIINLPEHNIFGMDVAFVSDPTNLEAMFADFDALEVKSIFGLFGIFIIAFLSVIILIKLIFNFFGVLGFLGNRDASVTAAKLSKFAKSTLGSLAVQITMLLIFSADDGVIAEPVSQFMLIVGVTFAVLYLLVRLYRWFISAKKPILDCLFDFLKDAIFVGSLIVLMSLTNMAFLDNVVRLQIYQGVDTVDGIMADTSIRIIIGAITSFIKFLILTSLMRKTLRLLPFNNYKRDAYGKLRGGYIALFVLVLLLEICALIMPNIINNNFAGLDYLALALELLLTVLPILLVMVAVCVAGLIEEKKPEFAYPIKTMKKLEEKAQAEAQAELEAELNEDEEA